MFSVTFAKGISPQGLSFIYYSFWTRENSKKNFIPHFEIEQFSFDEINVGHCTMLFSAEQKNFVCYETIPNTKTHYLRV